VRRAGLRGSFWPGPAQHELLRVALGPCALARGRWRGLQPLDLGALETGSFPLLPLLHERLADVEPEEERLPLLLGTYRSVWVRNRLLLGRLPEILAALRERGVEAVLVAGAAAAVRWYPRLGCRPVPQLELLVDAREGQAAREALLVAGIRPAGRFDSLARYVGEDERVLVLHEGPPPPLAGALGRGRSYRELRAAAVEQDVLGERVAALDPVDDVLFLCGTGARTTLPPTPQWLLDVHGALVAEERPEPEALVERAGLFRLVEPLRDTLAYLAQVAEPAPLEAYRDAVAAAPHSLRDGLAYRLGGAPSRGLGRVALAAGARKRSASSRGS
jgi:hypothetical protein